MRTAEVELEEPMLVVNSSSRGRVAVKLDAGSVGVNELMEVARG